MTGVRLRRDGDGTALEVRVVARYGVHLPTLAERVRAAAALAAGAGLDIRSESC